MNWSSFWGLLGIQTVICMLLVGLLWVHATRKRDASSIDVAWSALLGMLAVWDALAADGDAVRRAMVGLLGGLWGFRLALHLLVDRVLKAREEDGRYQELRRRWGRHAARNFFIFFQAQGILAAALSIPFLLAASAPAHASWIEYAAAVLWIIAFSGETLADRQLAVWKRDPANKGRTCRAGLWRYSRHPNYFCEWLMWCAYALLALAAPWGWTAVFAPALMLYLILFVTGIPPTEERALRSRGDDYRRYQATTSAFFPWFPKDEPAS